MATTISMCISNQFLEDLNQLLEEDGTDFEFGIIDICQRLSISRTHLHRKITEHTGKSISIYLRDFRLTKAYELLLTTNWRINRVTYASGFSDNAYFSRCFKAKYGVPPSEIRIK